MSDFADWARTYHQRAAEAAEALRRLANLPDPPRMSKEAIPELLAFRRTAADLWGAATDEERRAAASRMASPLQELQVVVESRLRQLLARIDDALAAAAGNDLPGVIGARGGRLEALVSVERDPRTLRPEAVLNFHALPQGHWLRWEFAAADVARGDTAGAHLILGDVAERYDGVLSPLPWYDPAGVRLRTAQRIHDLRIRDESDRCLQEQRLLRQKAEARKTDAERVRELEARVCELEAQAAAGAQVTGGMRMLAGPLSPQEKHLLAQANDARKSLATVQTELADLQTRQQTTDDRP
jgi:hypothetical protein